MVRSLSALAVLFAANNASAWAAAFSTNKCVSADGQTSITIEEVVSQADGYNVNDPQVTIDGVRHQVQYESLSTNVDGKGGYDLANRISMNADDKEVILVYTQERMTGVYVDAGTPGTLIVDGLVVPVTCGQIEN